MKIHEYQAKELLRKYGVTTPRGIPCFTVDEAVQRVGYEHVYSLVSYAVALQVLVRPLEAYQIEADELWRMSVSGEKSGAGVPMPKSPPPPPMSPWENAATAAWS